MKIGNVEINGHAALAPMAGLADRAMRITCVQFGAAYVVGEMVSGMGLCHGDEKSARLLELDDSERPAAIQLFGGSPEIMARAAQIAMKYKPDIIDINMGCPVPKIVGSGYGSALMRNPGLCRDIVAAVSKAVEVPVTAKIRKGFDHNTANAVEVALACQEGGACAVTVHGRTRGQMYAPPADWDIIKSVKNALRIPVIGNGDVTSAEEAARLYEHTGCDLVMVGRGALGAPWIFAQINAYIERGIRMPSPSVSERMDILIKQVTLAAGFKGERAALLEARKHAAFYMRGLPGAAALRAKAGQISTLKELKSLCHDVCALSK